MAEKYPQRKELVTGNEPSYQTPDAGDEYPKKTPEFQGSRFEAVPFHTPRVQNQMLDKFLGFMMGPNNPRVMKGEVPFMSKHLGIVSPEETSMIKYLQQRFSPQTQAYAKGMLEGKLQGYTGKAADAAEYVGEHLEQYLKGIEDGLAHAKNSIFNPINRP